MVVCVHGLWHLGSVTAACLARYFDVIGVDPDAATIAGLAAGQPPVAEPGLADLLREGLSSGRLRFTTDLPAAAHEADIAWVTFDTPIDDDDRADVAVVCAHVERLVANLRPGTLVLLSSQVPVGTTRRLEQSCRHTDGQPVTLAYSPENLRLGKAIEAFTRPDRVVVGIRHGQDGERIAQLLRPFCERIEWMGVESAEMTKHALNAYLATAIALTNEIAVLCEQVGADAAEVERGLRSEPRIGPRAPVGPGSAFAGGTLARDIGFLHTLAVEKGFPGHVIGAVQTSNEAHKGWARHRLRALLGELSDRSIAVLGLAYKPGTDTLRRSSALETCRWLREQGATVQAYDPAVRALPPSLAATISLVASAEAALDGADAVLIATPWPDFKALTPDAIMHRARTPLVLDPDRLLAQTVGADPRIRYVTVGRAG
jgi:UDPglucose 6-dehydrogenase